MLASASTPTTQVIIAWESPIAVDPRLVSVDVSIEAPKRTRRRLVSRPLPGVSRAA